MTGRESPAVEEAGSLASLGREPRLALADGWASTIVQRIAAEPLTLAELDSAIEGLGRRRIRACLEAMRRSGQADLGARAWGGVDGWFRAVIEGRLDGMAAAGDTRLATAILGALHKRLFGLEEQLGVLGRRWAILRLISKFKATFNDAAKEREMSNSIRVVGACLLLCGFLVAGCGGDGDSSQEAGTTAGTEAGNGQSESADGGSGGELEPTSESKEEYVVKANALCRKRKMQIQADLSKLLQSLPSEGSPEAGARKIVEAGLAPGLEAEVDELRRLGAPEGDKEQIEALLSAIEATLAEARQDPKAFVSNTSAFVGTQKLAAEYGLNQCGRPS